MEIKDYRKNMEEYRKMENYVFSEDANINEVLSILKVHTLKKKELFRQNNAFLAEFLEPYENNPSLITEELNEKFAEAFNLLRDGLVFFDRPVSLRLAKLEVLYQYYNGNWNSIGKYLVFSLFLQQSVYGHVLYDEDSIWKKYRDAVMEHFSEMNDEGQDLSAAFLLASNYDRSDRKFAARNFIMVREFLSNNNFQITDKKPNSYNAYFSSITDVCTLVVSDLQRHKDTYSEEDIELVRKLKNELEFISFSPYVTRYETLYKVNLIQLRFLLGEITFNEMMNTLEEIPSKDIYVKGYTKITNIFLFSKLTKETKIKKSQLILKEVLDAYRESSKDPNNYLAKSYLIIFIQAIGNYLGYEPLKKQLLEITVYQNKQLYIHSALVARICSTVVEEILNTAPEYFTGVLNLSLNEINEDKEFITGFMKECAWYHDVGKHACMDFATNVSRSLTEDEMELIRHHVDNYQEFFMIESGEEAKCVGECMKLHHVWFNEKNGYPAAKHTYNKPFVNIISIADALESATDSISHSFKNPVSLDGILIELEGFKDTRYSGYVIEVINRPHVKEQLEKILTDERNQLYYEVYTGKKIPRF